MTFVGFFPCKKKEGCIRITGYCGLPNPRRMVLWLHKKAKDKHGVGKLSRNLIIEMIQFLAANDLPNV